MNKRIDELFGQTMDQAVPETWTTLTHAQLLIVKDKFAELIVKECADLNFRELGLSGSISFDIGRMIKQHFGVKE